MKVEEQVGYAARIFDCGKKYEVPCTRAESDEFNIGVGYIRNRKLSKRLEKLLLASGARYMQPGAIPSMFARIYRCPIGTIERLSEIEGVALTLDDVDKFAGKYISGRMQRKGASLAIDTGPAVGPNGELLCFVELYPKFRIAISGELKSLISYTDTWFRSAGAELVVAEGRFIKGVSG
jgi:hypothetical protein